MYKEGQSLIWQKRGALNRLGRRMINDRRVPIDVIYGSDLQNYTAQIAIGAYSCGFLDDDLSFPGPLGTSTVASRRSVRIHSQNKASQKECNKQGALIVDVFLGVMV